MGLEYPSSPLRHMIGLVPQLQQAMKQIACSMFGQNGTIRFGRDPKTSALDDRCKSDDLDKLYVVNGSFFPSSPP